MRLEVGRDFFSKVMLATDLSSNAPLAFYFIFFALLHMLHFISLNVRRKLNFSLKGLSVAISSVVMRKTWLEAFLGNLLGVC